jgi:hypothetical protein
MDRRGKHLKKWGKDKPVPPREKQRAAGRKGGVASGAARRGKALISENIKIMLADEQTVLDTKGKKIKGTGALLVCTALFNKALKGDVMAAKELMDRTEGKVVDKVEQKTETVIVNLTEKGLKDAGKFVTELMDRLEDEARQPG